GIAAGASSRREGSSPNTLPRSGSRESRPPDLIRLSTARLFTFRRSTRDRRSRTDRNGPSLRASRMESIADAPNPLIAERPKRIAPPEGKKANRDSFTSGGRIGVPFSPQYPH